MRVVVGWSVLALLLCALAAAQGKVEHLSATTTIAFCVLYAAVIAIGVSTSTAMAALRAGAVAVANDDVTCARWGIWRRALQPVAAAAVVAAVVGFVLGPATQHAAPPFVVLLVSSLLAVVVARALTRVPQRARVCERGRLRWLVVEGALPAALMAAVVGVVVAVIRYGGVSSVTPGALARTLAGTCLCYLLLGLGGFAKAFHEYKSGVVVVVGPPLAFSPGPVFPGLFFAVLVVVLGPLVLPPIVDTGAGVGVDVVVGIVKGVVGFVVGGALNLLGALSGHRAAWQAGGEKTSVVREHNQPPGRP